jgi:hypothetical protein
MTQPREIELTAPTDGDWPAILELANRSVADVAGAPTQEAWLANRRTGAMDSGVAKRWVARDRASGELVGFLAVERIAHGMDARLFVVTDPGDREDVGRQLLERGLTVARESGVVRAVMVEYASDDAFLSFLRAQGFRDDVVFALPEGGQARRLVMEL